jgi:hypothetical protein
MELYEVVRYLSCEFGTASSNDVLSRFNASAGTGASSSQPKKASAILCQTATWRAIALFQ